MADDFLAEETQDTEGLNIDGDSFPPVDARLADAPLPLLNDPSYYKAALSGEPGAASFHQHFQSYLNNKDPKQREEIRSKVIDEYWALLKSIAMKGIEGEPEAKRYLLRFGMVHPALLSEGARNLIGRIPPDNSLNVSIHYLDEWLSLVAKGIVPPSAGDEVRISKTPSTEQMRERMVQMQARMNGARTGLFAKQSEKVNIENMAKARLVSAFSKIPLNEEGVFESYNQSQKQSLAEITELLKKIAKIDIDHAAAIREYTLAQKNLNDLQAKIEPGSLPVQENKDLISGELDIIRRMARVSVGRNGNHFPILTSEYFHPDAEGTNVGFRENVMSILSRIESLDAGLFRRTYKKQVYRITPDILLLPCFADAGICWEPFDRANRVSSRGRLIVPLYPKDLKTAILGAAGDLRWQAAKEKASLYWMEEGLTGYYFQWYNKNKLRGDIKEFFIQDYINWIGKESGGIQKLDRDVRAIFWQFVPFPRQLQEDLKNRSQIYLELYQKIPWAPAQQ
ncbi:MAG: hypothetical protein LBM77_14310 [Spirochaetaceae bacterium]|jgi:hypothetical protein|nr:hypothetical protein [Spirochaetaceae bacterium]